MATSTRDAELYQVANYGIAGQYDVHIDQVMMANDASSRMQKFEVFNTYARDCAVQEIFTLERAKRIIYLL